MDSQLLNLNLSQLVRAWNNSKDNSYADKRQQEYHDCLGKLFGFLKQESFEAIGDVEKRNMRDIISFFQKSLELLDSNTINSIPFELIECIKLASSDWISDHDQYIILTSYGDYAFVIPEDISLIYHLIESKYNIKFKYKLIQIKLPKYLFRDYLTNVVLYHELGHFVDNVLKISPVLTDLFFVHYASRTHGIIDEIITYFPFLEDPHFTENDKKILIANHTGEYFSDIFASQYIGSFINQHLIYLSEDYPTHASISHPSLTNRVRFVDEFLNNTTDGFVLKSLKETLFNVSKCSLEKRFIELKKDDFLSLIPSEIDKKENLHSLFKLGWDIWLNESYKFKLNNNMKDDLLPSQVYTIINSLIEKSINNFIIIDLWTKNK